MKPFANTLLHSSCAARRGGPKTRRPALQKRSTMPQSSGASGPMMVRSIDSCAASAHSASTPDGSIGTSCASRAIPAFPGAHSRLLTPRSREILLASACSRPPPPTIRTFIRQDKSLVLYILWRIDAAQPLHLRSPATCDSLTYSDGFQRPNSVQVAPRDRDDAAAKGV